MEEEGGGGGGEREKDDNTFVLVIYWNISKNNYGRTYGTIHYCSRYNIATSVYHCTQAAGEEPGYEANLQGMQLREYARNVITLFSTGCSPLL